MVPPYTRGSVSSILGPYAVVATSVLVAFVVLHSDAGGRRVEEVREVVVRQVLARRRLRAQRLEPKLPFPHWLGRRALRAAAQVEFESKVGRRFIIS